MSLRAPPFAALVALLLSLHFPAAALSVILPTEPGAAPIRARSEVVRVRIEGPLAVTTLSQVFHNAEPRPLEGTFILALPREAQLADFEMTINGRKTRPEVVEQVRARQLYEDVVRRMRDPGLIEYVDARTIRVRVFPIPANGDMPVELSFAQPLRREGGLYAYDSIDLGSPSGAGGCESEFSAEIAWDAPIGVVYSPTAEVQVKRTADRRGASVSFAKLLSGRLTLLFSAEEDDVELHLVAEKPDSSGRGTFMLAIHPPTLGAVAKPIAKDVTFVVDRSSSMSDEGKMEKAKGALLQCLGRLTADDRFNIIAFSTTTESLFDKPEGATAERVASGRAFVEALSPRGGTAIADALAMALSRQGEGRFREIVFLTDGLPTVGLTEPAQIVDLVRDSDRNGLRIFTFGVGFDVNTRLLDRLADETRAVSTYVAPKEDLEAKVSDLFDAVAFPVLTELSLDIEGVKVLDTYPRRMPDLFRGRDLLVFGSYEGSGEARIRLGGKLGAASYERALKARFPASTKTRGAYVAALWAQRKVSYLLDEIRLHGENRELRDEVLALAKEFNLVTPYTSYLVMEDRPPAVVTMNGIPVSPLQAPNTANYFRGDGVQAFADYQDTDTSPFAPSLPYSAAESGAAAVGAAKAIGGGKRQEVLADRPAESLPVRVVAGCEFRSQGGGWVQAGGGDGKRAIRVKSYSAAYFRLLERFPAAREKFALGDRLKLVLGEYLVEIGESGTEAVEELPKGLR